MVEYFSQNQLYCQVLTIHRLSACKVMDDLSELAIHHYEDGIKGLGRHDIGNEIQIKGFP